MDYKGYVEQVMARKDAEQALISPELQALLRRSNEFCRKEVDRNGFSYGDMHRNSPEYTTVRTPYYT
jgi:hypothetical protein